MVECKCNCGRAFVGGCPVRTDLEHQMTYLDNPEIIPPLTEKGAKLMVQNFKRWLDSCEERDKLNRAVSDASKKIELHFK